MACTNELHLNDEGTELLFNIIECIDGVESQVDLSGYISIDIRFLKFKTTVPLDVVGEIYEGGANGNETDGIVKYITKAGDIDVIGKWKVQIKITFIDGIFNSNIDKTIKVVENL